MIGIIPDWPNKTPQECLDYLTEQITVPSKRGRLTHSWVAENISLEVADAVYAAIWQVSAPSAVRYNVGDGIDTTAEKWKQSAEAVAESSADLAPYLQTLRDFEAITGPRWQLLGYDEPTLESITIEHAKALLFDAATDRMQAFRESLSAWDGSGEGPVL